MTHLELGSRVFCVLNIVAAKLVDCPTSIVVSVIVCVCSFVLGHRMLCQRKILGWRSKEKHVGNSNGTTKTTGSSWADRSTSQLNGHDIQHRKDPRAQFEVGHLGLIVLLRIVVASTGRG